MKNCFVWNNSAVTSSVLKKLSQETSTLSLHYGNSRLIEFNDKISKFKTDGTKMLYELKEKQIDYVFSNSEANSRKLLDFCSYYGFKCIGAKQNDCRLESSKSYSKFLMEKYCIKTAKYCTVDNKLQLKTALKEIELPCVIKADGLARSLSVKVIYDEKSFFEIAEKYLEGYWGFSSKKIIIEEFIIGKEVSVPLILDGNSIKIFNTVKDYKRKNNGNTGVNTGGLGALAPYLLTPNEYSLLDNLIEKLSVLLKNENHFYKGFMTINVIFTSEDVYLLEINTRLGDSEGQTVLKILETNLSEIFEAMYLGKINNLDLKFKPDYSMSVNIINSNYPDGKINEKAYIKKESIDFLLNSDIELLFYKNAKLHNDQYQQGNDRFLSLVSSANQLNVLQSNIYSIIKNIDGENIYYRTDIGNLDKR